MTADLSAVVGNRPEEVVFCGVPGFARKFVTTESAACRWTPLFVDEPVATLAPRIIVYYPCGDFDAFGMGRLEFCQLLSVGADHLNMPLLEQYGVVVSDHGDANAIPVAEQTVMLALAMLRDLPAQVDSLASGRWRAGSRIEEIRELRGTRVGVVGCGRTGSRVASLMGALGADVAYCDIEEKDMTVPRLSFEALVAWAQLFTLHVPLTPETFHLVGDDALRRMAPGGYVANMSRGEIVDEDALFERLRSGHLRGAALDVFPDEPVDARRLVDVPNLIATPHRAGASLGSWERRLGFACANVERWLRNEPVDGRIL